MTRNRQAPPSPPIRESASHAPPAGALREPMQGSHRCEDEERAQFAEHLRQRGDAARDLGDDLLTEVPLLYGSPGGGEPRGDPGILLAEMHRDELVRRHGGNPAHLRARKAPAELPFERTMLWLSLLLLAGLFFAS